MQHLSRISKDQKQGMTEPVQYRCEGDIGIITIDNPPVNALSHTVRAGLRDSIKTAGADSNAKVVIIVGAGRTFIAGADIREFGKPPVPPMLTEVIEIIEGCDKPVIAALHGTALGGGLEVALGCHYRVALPSAKVGLPEVLLGIIPGAGGTQRTPRLTGVEAALELITSGRHIKAAEALDLGLIDEIIDTDTVLDAGLEAARRAIEQSWPVRRVSELDEKLAPARDNPEVFEVFRKTLEKKARGLFSPFKCVDAVQAAVELPFAQGVKRERELFMECMESPQREGLIHAFFAERQVGKVPELKDGSPRSLEKAGVIGGGTMGAGIAVAMLNAGLPVVMIERDRESAERGRANVDRILDGGVQRGKLTATVKDSIMSSLFAVDTDFAALGDADLVVEAVFEEMDVKKETFGKLDAVCKQGAVLASNTSYLDINEIAASTSRPGDVLGLHFFAPANLMRLLEVVIGEKTTADVAATGFALAKKLKKVGVRAGVCDGFIGNRILTVYRRQQDYMVEDGASPYEIDAAMKAFGYPMGPYEVTDLSGLDIGWATRKRRAPTRDNRERYVGFADRICERGWFGQKAGRGYYLYEDGVRGGKRDPEVEEIIAAERDAAGVEARDFSHEAIQARTMAAMINEAAKIVEEGIALRPLDVDMVMLSGYGFPRWRGGPMKYADMMGLDKVLASIREFEKEDGYFWRPANLLVDLVEKGATFDSLNKSD